jgi:hypothetical protein
MRIRYNEVILTDSEKRGHICVDVDCLEQMDTVHRYTARIESSTVDAGIADLIMPFAMNLSLLADVTESIHWRHRAANFAHTNGILRIGLCQGKEIRILQDFSDVT